jgi:glycosyltransferase involved in cell wall biosynthesis
MITVAVCTRDRPEYLEKTLKHILRQRADCRWELLVINNGASDPVDRVVATLDSDVEIRVILEPQPGIDRARNRALQEARGDFEEWT